MSSEGRWDWGYAGGHQDCLRRIPKKYDAISFFFQWKGRGKIEVSIGPNMLAKIGKASGTFVIFYRGDHIVTVHRRGAVELGDPPRSRGAIDRVNSFLRAYSIDCQIIDGLMPLHGQRSPYREAINTLEQWEDQLRKDEEDVFAMARRFSFLMPARKGLCSDFTAEGVEQVLHIGCRLGCKEAADMLALCLRERGETAMAEAVLENKGRGFGRRARQKDMQAFFDVFWQLSEKGEWLVDLETKKLIRPLMSLEVYLIKLRASCVDLPATTTMPDGMTYGLTIGTDHVAEDKNTPRRIVTKAKKGVVHEP